MRRIILFCNVGRRVKDGVVHCSCQQSLVVKWLGLGVTVRVRVRARARLGATIRVRARARALCKVTKTFVLLS